MSRVSCRCTDTTMAQENQQSTEHQEKPERKPGLPGQQQATPQQQWLMFLWLCLGILLLVYYMDVLEQPQRAELAYTEFR